MAQPPCSHSQASHIRVGKPVLLSDSFNQPAFNTQLWNLTDPGSHLSLGGAGLVLSGGNGLDGQTTLVAIDQVEMGGSLVVEAGNLQLTSPSDGVLCGLYSGTTMRANCFAGYNVRQSSGSTVVTPDVNGAEVGTTYTVLSGHRHLPHSAAQPGDATRTPDLLRSTSMGPSRPSAVALSARQYSLSSTYRTWATPPTRQPPSYTTARLPVRHKLARQLLLRGSGQCRAYRFVGLLHRHSNRLRMGRQHAARWRHPDTPHRSRRGRRRL